MKLTRYIPWIAAVACAGAFGMEILPPDDGGGGGGGLPPPPPPATPGFLTYTPFTETSTLQVGWGARGNATNYVLDRLADGAWSRVYAGPATWVGLPLPGNG